MFNKKLKKRIMLLEEELGYRYGEEYHTNLEDGVLRRAEKKFRALVEYLDIENSSNEYGHYKYKKKVESK